MKFKYTGVTRTREHVAGVIESDNEAEARRQLRSMQIRPDRVVQAAEGSATTLDKLVKEVKDFAQGRIGLKKLILFTRQFSSLIDSGVPVVQALDILGLQEKKGPFKIILEALRKDIEAGNGLAAALAKYPRIFSEFYVRIVEAGEVSGTLDKALREIALQLDKIERTRAKVIKALSYPALTLVVAIGVLIFLLVRVVPQIAKLYSETKAKLPDLTLTVLALSDWVQGNYLILVAGMGGGFAAFIALYRFPPFRKVWDPFALKIPLFGSLLLRSAIAQISRTLGTLISSGVPLIGAFEICGKLVRNLAIKDSIRMVIQYIQEGQSISAGLSVKGIYPPMFIHMVNIGEMTGRLDELLRKVASIYDDEVDDAISQLTGLLQPAIIVVVGILIAFLLLAMYLPVFQLADKVAG